MIHFITGMLVGWAVRKQSEKLYRQRREQNAQQMQQARSPGRDWEVWQQIMRVKV